MTTLPHPAPAQPLIVNGDIPGQLVNVFRNIASIACDIETSGLDWHTHRPLLLQMCSPSGDAVLVRLSGYAPNAVAILQDPDVCKIFHHAMFDLRFLTSFWKVRASNVACTKIAAKLLLPGDMEAQRLHTLTKHFLGVTLDKKEQTSDWSAVNYTPAQIDYALNDVRYLPALYETMRHVLASKNLLRLAERCFAHIPTRVELELGGFGDVYTY